MVQRFPQQENLILRMGLFYGYSRARFIANPPTNHRQLTVASSSRYKYYFLPDSMKSCSRQGLLPRCLSSRCRRSHPPSRRRIGSPFHARRESGHSVPSFSTVDQCQRYSSLLRLKQPHTLGLQPAACKCHVKQACLMVLQPSRLIRDGVGRGLEKTQSVQRSILE